LERRVCDARREREREKDIFADHYGGLLAEGVMLTPLKRLFSSTRYPHPWMFLGAFACDGPERGFRGILFALERDYGLPDTCAFG